MKSLVAVLAALTLLVRPAHVQIRSGSLNAGLAFRTDTLLLETTFRISCRTDQNGVCLDGIIGFDWGLNHVVVYDIVDLDVGYSAAFGAERRTSLVLRAGGSAWTRNDKTDRFGTNGGIAVRHLAWPDKAWRVDFTWRRFSDFTLGSLCVGLEASL